MSIDPDVKDALSEIKGDVRDGFKEIKELISTLVTKGEFEATVARIDGDIRNTNERVFSFKNEFDQHETRTEVHMEQVRAADKQVMDKSQVAIEQVRSEMNHTLQEFKVTTRWAVTVAASATGIIVAAASALTSFIFNITTP